MKLQTEPLTSKSRFWCQTEQLAKEAFPPEEYLAPAELERMAQAENFDFLALLDEGGFVGFMVVQTYGEMAYLFFLAIEPTCRSKGYGSRALETLEACYPGRQRVVDLEMLDDAAPNNEQRRRRRSFYLKNGYRATGFFLSYLGVDYEVLCMDEDFSPEQFKAMMKTIRVDGFSPVYFTR